MSETMTQDFTQSFDARDWAKAFVEHVRANPSIATDQGTMLGWFANAIMRGYDEHDRRSRAPSAGAGAPDDDPPNIEQDLVDQFLAALYYGGSWTFDQAASRESIFRRRLREALGVADAAIAAAHEVRQQGEPDLEYGYTKLREALFECAKLGVLLDSIVGRDIAQIAYSALTDYPALEIIVHPESDEGLDLRDDWEKLVEENAALNRELAALRGAPAGAAGAVALADSRLSRPPIGGDAWLNTR
jgi:hypothetical protein